MIAAKGALKDMRSSYSPSKVRAEQDKVVEAKDMKREVKETAQSPT